MRVFRGIVDVDWSRPMVEGMADLNAAVAYYRFNPNSGPSQETYYFKVKKVLVLFIRVHFVIKKSCRC